jgi:metal-responsive CopG/Arc/MetJ family transcriptional regulator
MRVTFDIPDELATHLSRIARGNLMSRSLLLRHICAKWLDSYIKVQKQKERNDE